MDRSLATKYRPAEFNDIVGQKHVKLILEKQIKEDNLRSAYLFVGSAGSGKTTSARCMARSINGSLAGLVEIDAASNSGADSMRELVENSKFKALGCTKKIYILDECHALSPQSWQVALKTIEDGVKDVIFIFCTTERHKVPATIVSRCQVFDFQRITSLDIRNRLQYIQNAENQEFGEDKYNVSVEGLDYISKLANGGMRLAISMYEKVINCYSSPSLDNITEVLGTSSYKDMFAIVDCVYNRDCVNLIKIIERINLQGKDFKRVTNDFVDFVLELTKYSYITDTSLVSIPEYYLETLVPYDINFMMELVDGLIDCTNAVKSVDNPKNYLLGKLLQLC